MISIDNTADVASDAIIGDNVRISSYAIIESGVSIGIGTEIKEGVIIRSGTRIGRWNRIFPYAVIGEEPQDIHYTGDGGVEIGDNNIIREFVTIHRGCNGGDTKIGDNNYIMVYSHIGHNSHIGSNVRLMNGVTLGGWVQIQSYAYISAFVPIHPFVRVGKYSLVGGGYRIIKDVVPFGLAAGEPLKIVGVNIKGLKYYGFPDNRIEKIKDIFRIIFRSGLNTSQALKKIEKDFYPDEDIISIVDFIKNSKRGITK